MANYISSNDNRFYAGLESGFGQVPAAASIQRFPAVELHAQQQTLHSTRRDKTGTRTYLGSPAFARSVTAFEVTTYLTSWNGVATPGYGALLQGACGGVPSTCSQLTVSTSVTDINHLQTSSPHGLSLGSGISQGSEIRFVSGVVDPETILLSAPFSAQPGPGAQLVPCLTYPLGNVLPSLSLFDYWDPTTAISRVVTGATVDSCAISVNGNFHQLSFSGPAADLLDSQTFAAGTDGLATFPQEPDSSSFDYTVVAGHLGQAWLGFTAERIFTLTQASIHLKNNIVARNMEFGSLQPRSFAAGPRDVSLSFSLFADDSAGIKELYAAAKQRAPISAVFQLGQQQGQMMGIYLPSVVLEMPLFDDREPRLIWDFRGSIAQGTKNDELFICLA